MATFTRTARHEFPSTDPARRGAIDVAYSYMDEHFQTFMLRIPLDQDTPERIVEELRKAVARADAGGTKTIEI